MAHISRFDATIRSKIADDIQQRIDSADDFTPPEFIAGLETALAIVTGFTPNQPKEIRNV